MPTSPTKYCKICDIDAGMYKLNVEHGPSYELSITSVQSLSAVPLLVLTSFLSSYRPRFSYHIPYETTVLRNVGVTALKLLGLWFGCVGKFYIEFMTLNWLAAR